MPSFRHKRTGKIVTVDSQDAFRFNNARYELIEDTVDQLVAAVTERQTVPSGTVAEVLEWAGDDLVLRAAALKAEKAGKNRKGILEALS